MNQPVLAVITLDERGGGVAAVARLMRETLHREWPAGCRLLALAEPFEPDRPSGRVRRAAFAGAVLGAQVIDRCPWVLFSHPALARVQRLVPAAWRRPYAIFVHGMEGWRPLSPVERRVYDGARVCLTNSRHTARRVVEANPGLKPLVVCPLALPPGYRRASTARRDLGPAAVLLVGRMSAAERYKGHDALLDVWPAVRARVPDARLVFVGEGDDVPRLRERAAALGEDAVRFTGFLPAPDLDACYAGAAALAMPSRGEGFGLAYLEAMAQGVPCIGSTEDAAGEVIEDGVTGYLVAPGDGRALTDRLVTLLTDSARRAAMSARGVERVAAMFHFEKFASRLRDTLVAAFGAPPAAHASMAEESR